MQRNGGSSERSERNIIYVGKDQGQIRTGNESSSFLSWLLPNLYSVIQERKGTWNIAYK